MSRKASEASSFCLQWISNTLYVTKSIRIAATCFLPLDFWRWRLHTTMVKKEWVDRFYDGSFWWRQNRRKECFKSACSCSQEKNQTLNASEVGPALSEKCTHHQFTKTSLLLLHLQIIVQSQQHLSLLFAEVLLKFRSTHPWWRTLV